MRHTASTDQLRLMSRCKSETTPRETTKLSTQQRDSRKFFKNLASNRGKKRAQIPIWFTFSSQFNFSYTSIQNKKLSKISFQAKISINSIRRHYIIYASKEYRKFFKNEFSIWIKFVIIIWNPSREKVIQLPLPSKSVRYRARNWVTQLIKLRKLGIIGLFWISKVNRSWQMRLIGVKLHWGRHAGLIWPYTFEQESVLCECGNELKREKRPPIGS